MEEQRGCFLNIFRVVGLLLARGSARHRKVTWSIPVHSSFLVRALSRNPRRAIVWFIVALLEGILSSPLQFWCSPWQSSCVTILLIIVFTNILCDYDIMNCTLLWCLFLHILYLIVWWMWAHRLQKLGYFRLFSFKYQYHLLTCSCNRMNSW